MTIDHNSKDYLGEIGEVLRKHGYDCDFLNHTILKDGNRVACQPTMNGIFVFEKERGESTTLDELRTIFNENGVHYQTLPRRKTSTLED